MPSNVQMAKKVDNKVKSVENKGKQTKENSKLSQRKDDTNNNKK